MVHSLHWKYCSPAWVLYVNAFKINDTDDTGQRSTETNEKETAHKQSKWYEMKSNVLRLLTIKWADQKWWHSPVYEGYISWAGLKVEEVTLTHKLLTILWCSITSMIWTLLLKHCSAAEIQEDLQTLFDNKLFSCDHWLKFALKCATPVRTCSHCPAWKKGARALITQNAVSVRVLANGTHRPGSGCCTSCMHSQHPLCEQTPLRPHPPWPGELASRHRTHRTAPADKVSMAVSHRGCPQQIFMNIKTKLLANGWIYSQLCPLR